MIFDDTTIAKSGKKMEFIGRVWDHVTQLLSFRYRYENYESMGALFRSMNADELLGKILTDPVAEHRLEHLLGNCLKEAG